MRRSGGFCPASARRAAVAVAGAVALLAACSSSPDVTGTRAPARPPTATGHEWAQVGVAGKVTTMGVLQDVVVAGASDDQQLFLSDVTDGQAIDIRGFPGTGIDGVAANGATIMITDAPASERTAAAWTQVWTASYTHDGTGFPRGWKRTTANRGTWLTPLTDGQKNLRAVGVSPGMSDSWALHAWTVFPKRLESADLMGITWVDLNAERFPVYLTRFPRPETLLAGTTASTAIAAGDMSADIAAPRPEVWGINGNGNHLPENYSWKRYRLPAQPDGFTDLNYGDQAFWVAGHLATRPVVYAFGATPGTAGRALPMPATRLDATKPAVFIANRPVDGPVVLAVQAPEGPVLWTGQGTSWTKTALPHGRLTAARTMSNGNTYVVIDGKLWFQRLSGF